MAKTVSELAREIISRLDQGEALESAISLVLTGQGVDEEVLEELQLAGLRDAVIHEAFHELLTGEGEVDLERLGKLGAFSGVREYPARVKCATLAWHTLRAALDGSNQPASTE